MIGTASLRLSGCLNWSNDLCMYVCSSGTLGKQWQLAFWGMSRCDLAKSELVQNVQWHDSNGKTSGFPKGFWVRVHWAGSVGPGCFASPIRMPGHGCSRKGKMVDDTSLRLSGCLNWSEDLWLYLCSSGTLGRQWHLAASSMPKCDLAKSGLVQNVQLRDPDGKTFGFPKGFWVLVHWAGDEGPWYLASPIRMPLHGCSRKGGKFSPTRLRLSGCLDWSGDLCLYLCPLCTLGKQWHLAAISMSLCDLATSDLFQNVQWHGPKGKIGGFPKGFWVLVRWALVTSSVTRLCMDGQNNLAWVLASYTREACKLAISWISMASLRLLSREQFGCWFIPLCRPEWSMHFTQNAMQCWAKLVCRIDTTRFKLSPLILNACKRFWHSDGGWPSHSWSSMSPADSADGRLIPLDCKKRAFNSSMDWARRSSWRCMACAIDCVMLFCSV